MCIFSPSPMFDHLLELSRRDDSNKWSNIGFGEEMTQVVQKKLILHMLIGALYSAMRCGYDLQSYSYCLHYSSNGSCITITSDS